MACCDFACRKTDHFSQAKWINRLLVLEGDSGRVDGTIKR
jgi:hypothetical protein